MKCTRNPDRLSQKRGPIGQAGAGLLVIVVIISLLTTLSSLVFMHFDSTSDGARSLANRKKAFFTAEGARHISTALIQDYLSKTAEPSGTEIETLLNTRLPELLPAGYSVSALQVELLGTETETPIPNGPFAGMSAPQTQVKLSFVLSSDNEANVVGEISTTLSLAQISMFQFTYFVDLNFVDWYPGTAQDINGHTHTNGDVCIGSGTGIRFQKLTVAGTLLSTANTTCAHYNAISPPGNAHISTDGGFTNFATLRPGGDHGCTDCLGSGMNWREFASNRWNGHLQDKAHNVPKLKLIDSNSSVTQPGADGSHVLTPNTDNLRFLVDPVRAGDPVSIKTQKFAYNADIRIIDGVWYLRDLDQPDAWPGIPIWSDHPGRATIDGLQVGQDDIRQRWQGSKPWAATPPRGYSYYEYDSTTNTLVDDTAGVISYGNLILTGSADTPLVPGHWLDASPSSPICAGGAASCGAACGFLNALTPNVTCSDPAINPDRATLLLNATRGGFVDGHIEARSIGTSAEKIQRSRILPTNFDVHHLQLALQNTAPGELGSYFGAAREFNGIVYISLKWPGSEDGYGTSSWPQGYPFQGSLTDIDQIAATAAGQQQALPYPLCSNGKTHPDAGLATEAFDQKGSTARFKIPNCASYGPSGTLAAYPNSVRIINGQNLNPAVLTKGLSIVSNQPIYLAGNFNTSSDTSSISATPWVSSLVAGDQIIVQSSSWNDVNSPWHLTRIETIRPAMDTTYKTALLTGWMKATTSVAFNGFPGMMEDWTGRNLNYIGSIVAGYYPVYQRNVKTMSAGTPRVYEPPQRFMGFDEHFRLTANQPPGTPLFHISAVASWRRY